MENTRHTTSTIDEYILQFPAEVQTLLQQVRNTIREAAPEAQEKISWQMPTFYLHGNLVHFAAFKKHIGFYPGANGIAAFQEELSVYKGAKGSVQFPIDKPIPFDIIRAIVKFRVNETLIEVEEKEDKTVHTTKSGFGVAYLNDEINALILKCEHKTLVSWACDCAEHTLWIFENETPKDLRPRQTIEAGRAWLKGEMTMWEARKFAFLAHASAREATSKAACYSARGCGHAVACAHVPTHAPVCAAYCVKAVGDVTGELNAEREWQYERLQTLCRVSQ
jgi:Uncharacterized conserved protein